jgi:Fe-S cluster assembly protein SufD
VASVSPTLPTALSRESLDAALAQSGEGSIPRSARYAALDQFEALPMPRAPQGRFWKHDYAKVDFTQLRPREPLYTVSVPPRAGVTVVPFAQARTQHRAAFEAAFGGVLGVVDDRFAALALAFQNAGTFVHVGAGTIVDEPIVITYEALEGDYFPYTLVALGDGAQATIVEEFVGGSPGIVCGIGELLIGAGATLTYSSLQTTSAKARVFVTRRARCDAAASLRFSLAELGSALARTIVRTKLAQPEASAEITAVFFNNGNQHVDLTTEVDHAVGPTSSNTIVKSVATQRGQGRYLGNIAIRVGATGADASLRDDALLLSKDAHIDSVPALEIASNDVKAFHGATVGSIDEEELFYVESRGIARSDGERMIALGFFEPALERFPGEALRARVRAALESKLE